MIVAFTSLHPSGATFLDWSWHWLKGNESFWNAELGWIPLVDDPTMAKNAHGHKKNHPSDIESWWRFMGLARDQIRDTNTDITFYPHLASIGDRLEMYVHNLNLLAKKDVSVVVIKRTMPAPYKSIRTGQDDNHDLKEFIGCNPDIDPAWPMRRIREIASIRLVPQVRGWLKEIDKAFVNLDDSILVLRDEEILDDVSSSMEKIFSHHDLEIVPSRLEHWKTVAGVWHHKLSQDYEFYLRLPEICESILKGSRLNLEDFHLGFIRQSAIMAHLMIDHGARLLLPGDDFPKNTADLHRYLKNHNI